jgi:plasmid maintenance system killer protein
MHSLKAGDTLLIGSAKTKAVVQFAQSVLPKGAAPGFQGRSLSFNGSSDFVELATAEALGLPNRSFTVEAWINLAADAPRDCPVLGSAAPRTALRALHLTIRDRRPYLGFFGEANDLMSTTELEPERWYHVAWRYDSVARTQSILVDGQLVATAANRPALLGSGVLFIGQWNGDRHFKGQIGELRIWNEARSEVEIAAGMRRVLNDPTGAAWQNLAGSWRFALSEGRVVAQDDSRHQRPGKVLGNPALRRVNSQMMQVQIEPVDLVCKADEGVYLLPYDYDTHAQVNQIARSLQDGSLLFLVNGGDSSEPVQPGTAALSDNTLSNRWVADAYGYALSFDAASRPLTTTQRLADYQTEANLTMEAWVKHGAFPKGFTEILRHQSGSPATSYRLGISHDLDALQENAPIYRVFAEVGGKLIYTEPMASANQWQHLAAVFEQAHVLKFKAGDRLDCGSEATLELAGDMTIEAVIQLDDLVQPQGILTKGKIQDGTDDDCTYSLSVNEEGRLVFAFEDNQNSPENHFLKSPFTLRPNQIYHIGVTRQHRTETDDSDAQVTINQWYEFHFYARSQDGVQYEIWKDISKVEDPERFEGSVGSGSQPLEIGWAICQTDPRDATKMAAHTFRGELGEVRLWSRALTEAELGKAIQGREKGLVSWWKLEENQGAIAQDAKSTNHATIYGARWVQSSDPEASRLRLYVNGDVVMTHVWSADNAPYGWHKQKPLFDAMPGFALGAANGEPTANPALQRHAYTGELDEIRIWKVARTLEQIQDNLFRPIAGDFEQLLAYYHASEVGNTLQDGSGRGLHLAIPDTTPDSPLTDATLAYFTLSTAPVSTETAQVRSALAQVKTDFHDVLTNAPAVQEYGDMQYDAQGNLIGVMKRCYAYIRNGQWRLLTGYKVGDLELEWVGQAQYDPQLIGFIEGAPPVPSENLTVRDNYEKVSTMELTEADQMMYTYANTRDRSYKTALNMKLGAGFKVKNEAGFGLVIETVNTNLVTGIKGNMETNTSWMQDSTVSFGKTTNTLSRLTAQGDWEEATRPRYPELGKRYVPKNVGFALVQSETADVFVMRLKHRDPARRVTVALRIQPNPDIPKDWNVIMFPMNPKYVKQGTLDGRVGLNADAVDYPNASDYSPDRSYFKPIEAYALKQRIEREQKELEADYRNYDVEPAGKNGMSQGSAIPLVGTSIGAAIDGGIALSQEDKLPDLTRRNLFNTYVWTADGGLFAETQQFMETKQEVIGGTFSLSGQIGAFVDFNTAIAGVAVNFELESFWGGSQTLTKTKTSASQSSFGVTVDLDVERNIRIASPQQAETLGMSQYDSNGDRAKCPGKVDGYRFMTFYLEPSQEHFKDFENKVIDRAWLEESNDPNAIALRQSIKQKVGKPWRVMHRVTYVSRVLPRYGSPAATPAEDTLRAANIESNWELIKRLEPYVQSKTRSYGEMADAIRDVISRFMPELASAESYIIEYMSRYYQVFPDSVLQNQGQ